MLFAYIWFSSDHVEARAPDPLLSQCLGECIRVNERAPTRVHEHSRFFHVAQEPFVDQVLCRRPARSQHEDDIALRSKRVGVDAQDRLETVFSSDGGVALGTSRRRGVGEVQAVCVAEWDETG